MKRLPWGAGLVVLGAVLFGLWIFHEKSGKGISWGHSLAAPKVNTIANYPYISRATSSPSPQAVSPQEFDRLRQVRDATLVANPDLNAEYHKLLLQMRAQQAKFDAAMVEADPKVAPLVAKLVALRESTSAHGTPSSTSN